jgi:hypothetical protein
MTTAIELANQRKVELSYLQTVGQVLADSHYFKDAHTAQQAVAKILAGQEFGMGVMEAMRSFHVIDGKVEMSADAQARLVKSSERYDYYVKVLTDEECSITFVQTDGPTEIGTSVFTMVDAERAGLTGKAWENYPRNMLFARAMTNGIAWFCPDAISGGRVYAPGEVSDGVWDTQVPSELEPGAVMEVPAAGMGVDGEGEEGTLAYGEGASAPDSPSTTSDPEAPSSSPLGMMVQGEDTPGTESDILPDASGSEPRALSSQIKTLMRHATDLRWNDDDISAAVDEAYPGLDSLRQLSQEQARALIPEWSRIVKATRPTKEQRERLKQLATPADALRRAQVLFDADVVKNLGDLTNEEMDALIEDLQGSWIPGVKT